MSEEETGFAEDLDGDFRFSRDESVAKFQFFFFTSFGYVLIWDDDDELLSLIAKENETNPCFGLIRKKGLWFLVERGFS